MSRKLAMQEQHSSKPQALCSTLNLSAKLGCVFHQEGTTYAPSQPYTQLSSHDKITHNLVYQACRETKEENVKPLSSTTELQASQLDSAGLGTHITYHTQNKEGPLLCYTVPQVSPSLQCYSGWAQKGPTSKSSHILAFTRFIRPFKPMIFL